MVMSLEDITDAELEYEIERHARSMQERYYLNPAIHNRIFSEKTSSRWYRNPDDVTMNVTFLWSMERCANELLRKNGFVFLSEVYALLGLTETYESRIAGWTGDGEEDGVTIDFGVFDIPAIGMAWMTGKIKQIVLHFNVESDIRDWL